MASYVAHYTKKRQIQEKKEDNLRRLIARGAKQETIIQAAEQVREARIRTLRARQAQLIPDGRAKSVELQTRWDAKIAAIRSCPFDALIAEFSSTAGT